MSTSFRSRHLRQSSFKLTVYFQFSSVRPFWKIVMTDPAKILSQFISSSFSSRHEHQSSFKLTVYFQLSSVLPCGKLKMKYPAKFLRQFMWSSFSSRHVCLASYCQLIFIFQEYVYPENSKWQTLRSFQADSYQVASVVVMNTSLVLN